MQLNQSYQIGTIRDQIKGSQLSYRSLLTNIGMFASSGVNSHHVARVIPYLIRKYLPIDIAGFFWSNQDGEMVDAYLETPYFLTADVLRSCIKIQNEEIGIWPSFSENVSQGSAVGYLLKYQNDRFYQSDHYALTFARINMHHIIDVVVHDGSRPYGIFLLMRSKENGSFSASEVQLFSKISNLANAAFKNTQFVKGPTKRTYDTGTVVIGENNKCIFSNLTAHQILWMLTRDANNPIHLDNNDSIQTLLNKACFDGIEIARQLKFYSESRECLWGEFYIRYQLDELNKTIAIQLQQMQPYACHLALRLNQENKLTPTQQMVCWLLLNGFVRKQISRKMDFSESTAAEHIQEVFNHFRVNSISDLLLNVYR